MIRRSKRPPLPFWFVAGMILGTSATYVRSAPTSTHADTPDAIPTCALLADPASGVADSPLVALLETRLSENQRLRLVERHRIAEVLKEQELEAVFGPEQGAQRIALGQLLKADLLLLLLPESFETQPLLRVILCECTYGARLRQEVFRYDQSSLPELSGDIVSMVEDTHSRFPEGVQRIIGVPPFVSRSLLHEYDPLRAQLADWVAAGLAAYPGTAVLEVEEARAIARELSMTGGDATSRVVPLFLGGEFRVESTGKQRGTVRLDLRITGEQHEERIQRDFAAIEAAVTFLREELPGRLLHLSIGGARVPLSAERQVQLLATRADSFAYLGEYLQSTSLREALLIVDPRNESQARILISEYMKLVPYKHSVSWGNVEPDRAVRNFRVRLSLWKRGVQIYESLVYNRLVDRETAFSLSKEIGKAINYLVLYASKIWEEPSPWPEPNPGKTLLRDLEDATQVHQRLTKEILPQVMQLETSVTGPSLSKLETDLFNAMIQLPWHEPERQHIFNRTDLDHYRSTLLRFSPANPGRCRAFEAFLEMMAESSHAPRSFTDEEYLQLLAALQASEQPLNRLYAEVGLVMFDYQLGRPGRRADATTTLAHLGDLEARYRGIVSARNSYFFRYLREICEVVHGPASSAPAASRSAVAATAQANQITLQIARLLVRTNNLDWMNFCASDKSGAPSWTDAFGAPRELIQAGDTDLFWGRHGLLIQREPGILEEIYSELHDDHVGFFDVGFDGRHIWAITCCEGVRVFDMAGRIVATVDKEAGLPTSENGGALLALSSGRVLAAGSFGNRKRAWIADLKLAGSRIQVHVFHEATHVPTDEEREDKTRRDLHAVFVPVRFEQIPRPRDRSTVVLACSREGWEPLFAWDPVVSHHLEIDPEQHTVQWYELPRSESSDTMFGEENLLRMSLDSPGRILRWRDYLYSTGNAWSRYHVGTKTRERLGSTVRVDDSGRWLSWFGVSRHLGVVGWNQKGAFYQAVVHPVNEPVQSNRGLVATFTSDLDPVRGIRPFVHAIHAFHDRTGVWPPQLSSLVPQDVRELPPLRMSYHSDPTPVLDVEGAGLQVDRETLHVRYVFGGHEQGWYRITGRGVEVWPIDHELPRPMSSSSDAGVTEAARVFDDAIAAEPRNEINHWHKTCHLFKSGETAEARDACLAWIEVSPKSLEARFALIEIERILRFGHKRRVNDRATENERYPTLAAWRLLNNQDTSTGSRFEKAFHQLPFAADQTEWYIAETAALSAAEYCLHHRPRVTIEICNIWEREAQAYRPRSDASYLSLRAAARLKLGEFEAARTDAEAAAEQESLGALWRGNIQRLMKAIQAQDREFDYLKDETRFHENWKENCE